MGFARRADHGTEGKTRRRSGASANGYECREGVWEHQNRDRRSSDKPAAQRSIPPAQPPATTKDKEKRRPKDQNVQKGNRVTQHHHKQEGGEIDTWEIYGKEDCLYAYGRKRSEEYRCNEPPIANPIHSHPR